jgi:hypothetical protein
MEVVSSAAMPSSAPVPPTEVRHRCDHDHVTAAAMRAPRSWASPVVVGVLALGACLVLAFRDPNQTGSYGACPFKALTGWDCPGCGMLRGTNALLTGDPVRALDHNILLPVVLALGVFGYVRWTRRSLGHDVTPRRVPPWLIVAGTGVLLGFWLVRNLGGPFEYLASSA